MLQIFVKRDEADQIAYPSKPMGVRIGTRPITEYADSSPVKGQARIFLSPKVFGNEEKARIFHYCANPELCSMESESGELTRGSLLRELRTTLDKYLTGSAAERELLHLRLEFTGTLPEAAKPPRMNYSRAPPRRAPPRKRRRRY
mmetsp:Transcript_25657/g.32703  ORF Transcript_25657/g.32703 Transcript_25657/m.32703 type:complete len:145 (-) Transcript_25657:124-558(-)